MSENIHGSPSIDLCFVSGRGFHDRLIQLGQRLRYPREYAKWNHVAIYLEDAGGGMEVIEAQARGVTRTSFWRWYCLPRRMRVRRVRIQAPLIDRREMAAFARSHIGREYDWFTILTTALHLITAARISISVDSTDICSGLAASMLCRGQWDFPNPADVTPAALAQLLDVRYY